MNKETDEEGKKRGVSVERSKAGTKQKRSPDGLNYALRSILTFEKHLDL